MVEYVQFQHAQREKKTQACLTRGLGTVYYTRWRGMESYLINKIPYHATLCIMQNTLSPRTDYSTSGIAKQ